MSRVYVRGTDLYGSKWFTAKSLWAPAGLCTLPVLSDLRDDGRLRGGNFGSLCEKLSHAVRHLRAVAGPIGNAVALELDTGGAGPRIIRADHFDRPAVACAVLFDHNNAVVRLLPRTNARQTDHQHRGNLSQHDFGRGWRSQADGSVRDHAHQHLSIAEMGRICNRTVGGNERGRRV